MFRVVWLLGGEKLSAFLKLVKGSPPPKSAILDGVAISARA